MEVSNIDVAYNYQSKYPLPQKYVSEFSYFTTGDMKFSIINSDHGHWLLCDGRTFNPIVNSELYNLIGNSFGTSLGLPLLPDMRGRVPGAIGSGIGLTPRSLGNYVGEETHTLTIPEMPTHNHTNSVSLNGLHSHTNSVSTNGLHNHTINDPGHSHTYLGVQSQGAASGLDNVAENSPRPVETTSANVTGITINNNGSHNHTVTIDASGLHNHVVTIDVTGGSLPHNNMQPTLFIGNYFIYSRHM